MVAASEGKANEGNECKLGESTVLPQSTYSACCPSTESCVGARGLCSLLAGCEARSTVFPHRPLQQTKGRQGCAATTARENLQGNNPNHSRQQNRGNPTRAAQHREATCNTTRIQTSTTTVPGRNPNQPPQHNHSAKERRGTRVSQGNIRQPGSIKQLHLHVSKPSQHKAESSRVHQQPREPSQQLQVLQEKEGAKGVQCCRRAEEGQRGNVTMQPTNERNGMEECAATTTTNREVQRAGPAVTTATKRGEPRHEGNSRLVPERTAATTTTNSEVNEESTKQGNGGEGKANRGLPEGIEGKEVSQESTKQTKGRETW
jgi:hypothetical protein